MLGLQRIQTLGLLTNLIALHRAPDKHACVSFHVWFVPFLAAGAVLDWALLFAM